jgi:hypothetical protein
MSVQRDECGLFYSNIKNLAHAERSIVVWKQSGGRVLFGIKDRDGLCLKEEFTIMRLIGWSWVIALPLAM